MTFVLITSLSRTGYGITGTNLIKAAVKDNIPIGVIPTAPAPYIEYQSEEDKKLCEMGINYAAHFIQQDMPCIRLFHQNSMHMWYNSNRDVIFNSGFN